MAAPKAPLPAAFVVGEPRPAERRPVTPGGALRRVGFFLLVAAIVLYAVFPFDFGIAK